MTDQITEKQNIYINDLKKSFQFLSVIERKSQRESADFSKTVSTKPFAHDMVNRLEFADGVTLAQALEFRSSVIDFIMSYNPETKAEASKFIAGLSRDTYSLIFWAVSELGYKIEKHTESAPYIHHKIVL